MNALITRSVFKDTEDINGNIVDSVMTASGEFPMGEEGLRSLMSSIRAHLGEDYLLVNHDPADNVVLLASREDACVTIELASEKPFDQRILNAINGHWAAAA